MERCYWKSTLMICVGLFMVSCTKAFVVNPIRPALKMPISTSISERNDDKIYQSLYKMNYCSRVKSSCMRWDKTNQLKKNRNHRTSQQSTALSSSLLDISSHSNDVKACFYMFLLALQFGCQPILTKKFTPSNINRSAFVLVQDVMKFAIAAWMLYLSGNWSSVTTGWNVKAWLSIAGIPAALYSVQNIASLMAYQKLDPLTFNVLNQTKTLSAALCCYFLMRRAQSKLQIVSLLLLFTASLVIEKIVPLPFQKKSKTNDSTSVTTTPNDSKEPKKKRSKDHTQGVIAVLIASFISGLAGAISQKSLQLGGRNSYLFTMELCMASTILLFTSSLVSARKQSSDNSQTSKHSSNGVFQNWTIPTLIPIITNAIGGIIVGLVTKYAGAVKKGFALIFGLLLSGILQAFMKQTETENDEVPSPRVSIEQIVGGILAAISLWMHSSFPSTTK